MTAAPSWYLGWAVSTPAPPPKRPPSLGLRLAAVFIVAFVIGAQVGRFLFGRGGQ